jgi:polyphenol oxidase
MTAPSLRIPDADVFELPGGGRAFFTARAHGNMSSVGGDNAEQGSTARERLRAALDVRLLLRGYQVHGTVVGRVFADGSRPGLPNALESPEDSAQPSCEADGHAVAAPTLAAMVLSADCIPVVLGADGAVAAVHAGWRGLAAGVLEQGVHAVGEVGGRGELVAVVGPCAGACCYEVGEEVHQAFAGAHRDGRSIDLRAVAHERLLAAGVSEVQDLHACTICDERFFSYRREGVRAGRQGAVAWMAR